LLNHVRLVAVVAESLLVVASVGVQLTTTFASGRQTAMFYNIGDISGIVINEAVTMVKRRVVLDSHYDIVIVIRCNSIVSATCCLYKCHCHVVCFNVYSLMYNWGKIIVCEYDLGLRQPDMDSVSK